MSNTQKDYKKMSKISIITPIIITFSIIISLIIACVLDKSMGLLYVIFALLGIFGFFIAPLPCFVLSIIGTVFAIKEKHIALSVVGSIETVLFFLFICLAAILFITGQSI